MIERKEIVKLWRNQRDASAVLATLVRVDGSAYRRPGARMYIQAGAYVGSISGGCLEGEVARKAAWLTHAGAAVETYSTLYDNPFDTAGNNDSPSLNIDPAFGDAGEMPYGLGCGGVIELLLEPVASPETEALLLAFEAAQHGAIRYCATLLPITGASRNALARVVLDENGATVFASANFDAATLSHLDRLARQAASAETVSISIRNQARNAFIERIDPPQRLVILGAGDDARPLARMAHLMGWRVLVADGRSWLARRERFPEAEQVVALQEDARALETLQLTCRDAVAMMTHSFEQDKRLLPQLLSLDLRYLGLLGARHRSQLLLTQIAQRLGWTPEECLRRVHAPIGLNLGGDSPEAVALTIVAEIQSVLNAKDAISRGMSEEGLHSIPDRPYVPTQCPTDTMDPMDGMSPIDTAVPPINVAPTH